MRLVQQYKPQKNRSTRADYTLRRMPLHPSVAYLDPVNCFNQRREAELALTI